VSRLLTPAQNGVHRRLRPRRGLLIGLGVVAVLAALYGIIFLLVGGGISPNTKVADISIGGLSPADARAKLEKTLVPEAEKPITVRVGDQKTTVDPREAGLGVDVAATVAGAGTRNPNPIALVSDLFGHHTVAPVATVDDAKLTDAVDKIDEEVPSKGHDGDVRFDGITPVAVAPVKGEGLLKDQAKTALREGFLITDPIRLPTGPVDPAISADAVQRAIDNIAKPAVAAPMTLFAGADRVTLSPSSIAANLTFEPSGHELVPVVDGAGVAKALSDKLAGVERQAKSASFDFSSGQPVVVPSAPGKKLDAEKLGPAVAAVLTKPAPREVAVPTSDVNAKFTTDDAKSLGIKEKVSTFTTYHPCCAPRVTNIHKMADIVNGYIVMPGATFSLNEVVGERDRARGFVPAPMIYNGLYVDSVGGGVSQFTTTIYNAVFFAGLKDVEHHPHSYYISRYPAGREATISYPAPNFIFQNDTSTGIVIQTSYTGRSITVTFWGTKYYDITSTSSDRYAFTTGGTRYNTRPDCEAASGNQGFQIDVTQTFKQDGKVVKTRTLHTKYDPEPVIICGPAPTPTPAAASTPPAPLSE
jgi:vancomycin resistance protein YoaR